MEKIMLRRLAWLFLTGLIVFQSPLPAAGATITVTKEQAGREIALKVGDILQIELPSRGGTGYSWFAEANGAPYLKLMFEAAQQVGQSHPGSPVTQVWRFKAAKPGATEINLVYYRPWEGVGKAADHFRLRLLVE
jgi:predicted secreted protein